MDKEWHEAVDWNQRNQKGNPFALLGCPCNGYSHFCSRARKEIDFLQYSIEFDSEEE